MRRIAIIGAGQAGLVLALGLLPHGYAVTVVAERDAEAVRSGRLISNQCVFAPALTRERELGINFWDADAPPIRGVSFGADGEPGAAQRPGIAFHADFPHPAQSVDQRVKVSEWMTEFERQGGRLRYQRVLPEDLVDFAREFDLVLVAAGRGPQFDALFPRDPAFSPYFAPQRSIGITYIRVPGDHPGSSSLTFGMGPAGEFFSLPVWSVTGRVQGIGIFAVPGGPLDVWAGVTDVEQHLEVVRSLVRDHYPWNLDHLADAEPAAPQDFLHGRILPVVRDPVGQLPSGALVLAMGDTAVTNDPVGGQGANLAAYAARTYQEAILERGDRPFDEEFMRDAFARYWTRARHATRFTNDLLAPPSEWVMATLTAAQTLPEVARRFAGIFEEPERYTSWLTDEAVSRKYLADAQARAHA
ncbi:MAG TPA: styrene monooxygenase/indole monooxygenase family protein [Pseudonocardiaceae bacterium]|jgi:2-polyprenyl-6-methoxyphenol hydroxylase-like FAD-dependent oxidoreductase|nr:styrene monooxygenase/indole monooxygenase family protein [Pseudonocardiaceae bacterium]